MIRFDKIIEYIADELPCVKHFQGKFLTLDHVYRQYYTVHPYVHNGKMSDNLVIMSYIRPICNDFMENRIFPDRDYLCCIQKTTYDEKGINICFEPLSLTTCELIEAWVAHKFNKTVMDAAFHKTIVGIGYNKNADVIASKDAFVLDRVAMDSDFVLTGFIEPVVADLLDNNEPGNYLINCILGDYDVNKHAQQFRLVISKKAT